MTQGSDDPDRDALDQARARLGWRDRLTALERRFRSLPTVRRLLAILDVYNTIGGGLVASGLAFSALFAVIPGLLLVVSVLVVIVDDPATRAAAIDWIVAQVPPLQPVADQIVDGLAQGARVGTVVGIVLFLWGASGFYLALESTMERCFPGARPRDAVLGRVRGVAAVLLVVAAVLAAFAVSTGVSVVAGLLPVPPAEVGLLLSVLIAAGVASLVCGLLYRFVPGSPPSIGAATPAALLAGGGIGAITAAFGIVAPLLVGGFRGLGVIASVFVALVWFQYVFQMLLYGAAFARIRRDAERARTEPTTI